MKTLLIILTSTLALCVGGQTNINEYLKHSPVVFELGTNDPPIARGPYLWDDSRNTYTNDNGCYADKIGIWKGTNLLIRFHAITNSVTPLPATNVTLTTLAGKTYAGITLDHTNALGFVWRDASGSMGVIHYYDLTLDDLYRYGATEKNVAAEWALEYKNTDYWKRRAKYDANVAAMQAEYRAKMDQAVAAGGLYLTLDGIQVPVVTTR